MVTSQLNLDITRRTDDARKSTRRAENKLLLEFNKAGGLDDERRFQLSELKRKQTLLRKELHTLRFESRLSSRSVLQENGLWSRSADDLNSVPSEPDFRQSISADYGKNFYGYISEPGTKKVIKKPLRQIERSIDAYCKKIDEIIHQESINHKLNEQSKENQLVEEKLRKWKSENPAPQRKKFYKFISLHDLSVLNTDNESDLTNDSKTTSSDKISASSRNSRSAVDTLPPIFDNETRNRSGNSEETDSSHFGSPKARHFFLPKPPSKDLILDAEMYAPDGRVRMAHRMPEFQIAFNEARFTRHVRTKQKRDFEIPLNVQEIFK